MAEQKVSDEERSYRRGCHQTAAMVNVAIEGMKSVGEVKAFLRELESMLGDMRYSKRSRLFQMLHVATEAIKDDGDWRGKYESGPGQ